MTGSYDLIALGVVPTMAEMDVLTDRIGEIDGVERTTSAFILSTKFERCAGPTARNLYNARSCPAAPAYHPALKKSDFHYDLPPELIAQAPLPERSASRLLVVPPAPTPRSRTAQFARPAGPAARRATCWCSTTRA